MIRSLFHRSRDRSLALGLSAASRNVLRQHLTQLTPQKLQVIEQCIGNLDQSSISGDLIECGDQPDGSSLVLASLLSPNRCFCRYTLIQPDRPDASAHNEEKKLAHILAMFGLKLDGKRNSLRSIDPKIATALHTARPIALAHLICGAPETLKFYMEVLPPCVAPGGFIIINHYGNHDFAQKTIDRFLEHQRDFILDPRTRTSFLLQRLQSR